MTIKGFIGLATVVAAVVFNVAPSRTQSIPAPFYGIQDLGLLGETASYADDVTFRGHVVGTTTGTRERAFVFDGIRAIHLDTIGATLGGSRSVALGANFSGWITGWSNPVGSPLSRAFIFDGASARALGTLGGNHSLGQDINDRGWVTGTSSSAGGDEHAFLYNGAQMIDLGTFGGRFSYGYALNYVGSVTGAAFTPNFAALHAFLYNGSTTRDLGTLGGRDSFGRDINDSEWITGYAAISDNNQHAFLYDGVTMRDLATLGGTYSEGFGINDEGTIVGDSTLSTGAMRAFRYTNGQMIDLNALIDPSSGWVLTAARSVNQHGQIAGFGVLGGQTHAFLLTPPQDLEVWANGGKSLGDSNRPNPVQSGRTVEYFLTVYNLGGPDGDAVQPVTLIDTVSPAVEVIAAATYEGDPCDIAGQVVTCIIYVGGGGEEEVNILVRPTAAGAFSHTATVRGPAPDPNPDNNTVSEDNSAVSLSALSLTPAMLAGGKASSARVVLTSEAPSSGATVTLKSSNPAIVPVPPSIYVLGGGTTRVTNLVPKVVSTPTAVEISATYGLVTKKAILTVVPPAVSALTLTPTTVIGGCKTVSAKVTLTGSAPATGAPVGISEAIAAALFPTTLTVPAGSMSKTFAITTNYVSTNQLGPVTASYGGVSKAVTLTVRPIRVATLPLMPNPVVGGTTVSGVATLECPAAPGSIIVALSSTNTAVAAPLVSSITIPAGALSGSFSVRTSKVSAQTAVTIRGSVFGVRKSTTLTVKP